MILSIFLFNNLSLHAKLLSMKLYGNRIIILLLLSILILTGILPGQGEISHVLIYTATKNFKKESNKPVDLVFYIHGFGCNELCILNDYSLAGLNLINDPTKMFYRKDIVFASFTFKSSSPCSTPILINNALKEIDNIIEKFNTRNIKLIGISLGGTVALNIASLANKKIKDKITNIITVFPITDFEYTFSHISKDSVINNLKKICFNSATPNSEEMKLSSPINYALLIPNNTKITLIEATQDKDVSPHQIEEYYRKLKEHHKKVELVSFKGEHNIGNFSDRFAGIIQAALK